MHTAEPPFGNIKHNLGYRYFLLRGLEKVQGEFNLMCIGHNINKIYNFMQKKNKGAAAALVNMGKIGGFEENMGKNNGEAPHPKGLPAGKSAYGRSGASDEVD